MSEKKTQRSHTVYMHRSASTRCMTFENTTTYVIEIFEKIFLKSILHMANLLYMLLTNLRINYVYYYLHAFHINCNMYF